MPPLRILLFAFMAILLAAMVQFGALQIAFDKLGLAPESVIWLLMVTLVGSVVDVPLLTLKANTAAQEEIFQRLPESLRDDLPRLPGRTRVAVNVGGCVVPVVFSFYLFLRTPLHLNDIVTAIALVTLFAYYTSMLVPGVGIVMPMLATPLAAAFVGVNLDPVHAAPLAYIGGTLGVLLGADILRLRQIGQSGEPAISIGGAGSFDGNFLTGVLAVLLS